MAEILAIEWGRGQLVCVEADTARGQVTVKRCAVIAWPDDTDLTTRPLQAGQWLKEELRRLGISSRQAVAAVSREDTMVRHLELPNVPENELPDMVRFQAATKSSQPLDKLLLDYLPLPPRATFEGRDVLMATVPTSLADSIRQVLHEAGLDLLALGVTSVAASELIVRAHGETVRNPDVFSLVVARLGNRIEISILRGPHLVSSHSTQLMEGTPPQQQQALFAQINRSLVALQRVIGSVAIGQVWLVGSENEARPHHDAFAGRFGCPVEIVDPLSIPEVHVAAAELPAERAQYVGPIGMLLGQGEARAAAGVDFLHPRKPVVAKDWKQWRPAMIAAGLIVVLAGGYVIRHQHVSSLADEIAALQQKDLELNQLLDDGQPTLDSAKAVQDWQDANVVWLDPMSRIVGAMPGTDRLYLTEWTFNKMPSSNSVAQISATIRARERGDVYRFRDQLSALGMTPTPSTILEDDRDSSYPYRSELEINLKREAPAAAPAGQLARAGRAG